MLNLDKAKERLCKRFLPDFNIKLKRNDKGVTTISFKDEDTNVVVNLKFNENTLSTTIAPREMEKDEFRYGLKEYMNDIKQILNEINARNFESNSCAYLEKQKYLFS